MVREAELKDLDALLELYLDLHEESVPAKDEHLSSTWGAIISDPNHHLLVNEIDGKIVSSCVCVIIPNLTRGAAADMPANALTVQKRSRSKRTAIR